MLHKSHRYTLILTAVVTLATLLALGACGGGNDAEEPIPTIVIVSRTPNDTPVPRRTPSPTPVVTPTPLQVCAPNPNPAEPTALQVQEPRAEAQPQIPIHVRGWGSHIGQDERGVFVAIVDERQSILQINVVPPQPREFRVPPAGLEITEFTRPFAIDIVIPDVEVNTPYCIWVYQAVNEQGRAQGVVQVPIVVVPR